jgi:ABC-type glucose/galactose transport system permease subunit
MIVLPLVALFFPFPFYWQPLLIWLIWARGMWGFYSRAAGSNFPAADVALSVFGLPLMIYLLLQSWYQVRVKKTVAWKGRVYGTGRL